MAFICIPTNTTDKIISTGMYVVILRNVLFIYFKLKFKKSTAVNKDTTTNATKLKIFKRSNPRLWYKYTDPLTAKFAESVMLEGSSKIDWIVRPKTKLFRIKKMKTARHPNTIP